ncbi:MAG: hypothetical protein GX556_07935 [Fibrobacter sp.]|nr:hypothetical protein [Fibrobacter sp.]
MDPEGDADGDGLPNYTEVFVTNTDPLDPASFKEIAIPTPASINNASSDVTVNYDLTRFNEDYADSGLVITFGKNTLVKPYLSPAIFISNTPYIIKTDTVIAPVFEGYEIVGRYITIDESSFNPGGKIIVEISVPKAGPAPEACKLAVLTSIQNEWVILEPIQIQKPAFYPYRVYFELPSFSAIALVRNKMKATAYLDNGMIYSSSNKAIVKAEIVARGTPLVEDGFFQIYYTDYEDPSNPLNTSQTFTSIDFNGILRTTGLFSSTGQIVVTRLTLGVGSETFSEDVNITVARSECLDLFADKDIEQYRVLQNKFIANKSPSYSLESIDIDGEGRMFKTASGFFYDYYLKDHLGSTRMVMRENGGVTEAFAYQPYGKMVPLDDIVTAPEIDPTRQQFTTKEFDKEGCDNNDGRLEFNIQIETDLQGFVGYFSVKTTGGNFSKPVNYSNNGESLHCVYSPVVPGRTTIEKLSLHLINTDEGITVKYDLDDLSYSVEAGYKQTVILNRTLSEVQAADVNGANLYEVPAPEVNYEAQIAKYYFGARFYDPEIGIWLSTDPYEQDWNVYGYCGNNPVYFVDPDGNVYGLWNATGFIIGAAIGGTIGSIAAYNASDGDLGAAFLGSLVGSVYGGALGSMTGSGLSKLSDMGFFQSVGGSLNYSGNIFERIEARIIVKGLQMSSEVAKNLLGELSKNTVKDITVNIDRTSTGNHYNPNGTVTFNPELKTYYRKNQNTPKLPWQDNRDKVGLYHELRHAYQDINNQIPQSTYTNFNDRLKVELKNIGVGILKDTEKYSGNLFRESIGEALRDRYIVY